MLRAGSPGPSLLPWGGWAGAALSQGGRLRAGGVLGRRGGGNLEGRQGGRDVTGEPRERPCRQVETAERDSKLSGERHIHGGGQRRDKETDAWIAAESECPGQQRGLLGHVLSHLHSHPPHLFCPWSLSSGLGVWTPSLGLCLRLRGSEFQPPWNRTEA